MRKEFENGIAWGEAKKQLFELINTELSGPREKYNALMENPAHVEDILQAGAKRARVHSQQLIEDLRQSVGIRPLGT